MKTLPVPTMFISMIVRIVMIVVKLFVVEVLVPPLLFIVETFMAIHAMLALLTVVVIRVVIATLSVFVVEVLVSPPLFVMELFVVEVLVSPLLFIVELFMAIHAMLVMVTVRFVIRMTRIIVRSLALGVLGVGEVGWEKDAHRYDGNGKQFGIIHKTIPAC